jgi:2,4-dienoyl-CoA reductase (NADPH2)
MNPLVTPYPTLLKPLKVGSLTFKNRVIMGSMHTGLEGMPQGFERLAAFYAERARGGVSLIVTGGVGVNAQALGMPNHAAISTLCSSEQIRHHQLLTDAVHRENGLIALQMLHVGRYDHASGGVSASSLPSPLSAKVPRELSHAEIESIIEDYVKCARLAQTAGYDGAEIMGSEGYLINQFLVPRTNQRNDLWGGTPQARRRLAVTIVQRIREAVGADFLLIFRISVLDLVEHGSSWEEVISLALELEAAGVSMLNAGIGWHEARIPTIATVVPRGAFSWAAARLRQSVRVPVIASNRINTPEVAERILARGDADMVSMARPFLADPDFVNKAALGQAEKINTCIACNQACLDQAVAQEPVSCLVNPRACQETLWPTTKAQTSLRIAVVGAGPAGLSCALEAAGRGHEVTLFEKHAQIGGQFNLAARIPGKEEFYETLRYFQRMLVLRGVSIHVGKRVRPEDLMGYDHVVLATGVSPRRPVIPGLDHEKVLDYPEAIQNPHAVGKRVAILGAGGIGFDVAELLSSPPHEPSQALELFCEEWGIDLKLVGRGGLKPASRQEPHRQIWLLQRRSGKPGRGLARSTGWIRRTVLERRGVTMLGGVEYLGIDDNGLHLRMEGVERCLAVDHIVLCTGQESDTALLTPLRASGVPVTVIGGAAEASQLDARRAIDEGARVGIGF